MWYVVMTGKNDKCDGIRDDVRKMMMMMMMIFIDWKKVLSEKLWHWKRKCIRKKKEKKKKSKINNKIKKIYMNATKETRKRTTNFHSEKTKTKRKRRKKKEKRAQELKKINKNSHKT